MSDAPNIISTNMETFREDVIQQSMIRPVVVDFWAEPSYAQLMLAEQKRVHDFVVADKGTAKEALDGLVADWKKIFKDDGKLK